MPIHEYAPAGARHCPHCADGFDRLERLHDAPLEHCPECGAPVTRLISAPRSVRGGSHLLREDNLARHGFTQYRRIGKGQYEKTVGRGPEHISDK